MPVTYINIATQTLGTSAATITFNSIPNTYTDLVLRWSARATGDGSAGDLTMNIIFNNTGGTEYSTTTLRGNGTVAQSFRQTSASNMLVYGGVVGSGRTANTFSNGEIYLPSYTISANKPVYFFSVNENNDISSQLSITSGLRRNTAAVSRIDLTPQSGSFAANSTFYLYGIKNN